MDYLKKKPQFGPKLAIFLSHVTLKYNGLPWKTTGHLFYATSSFVHLFKAISGFKLELQSCDLEIWQMTFKNNRAPLPSHIKLCASFRQHMWIRPVQKLLNWVLTSVTLTFNLWHWPFAWTSLLSLVITPEKFHDDLMMGTLWKKCDTRSDGQTNGWSEVFLELLGCS